MPTKSGPALLKVKNPDGSVDGLIIDVHSTLVAKGLSTNQQPMVAND